MTKINPKVSIVIPCYNQGQFLAEAVKSCVDSTYRNIEVIIVDDGSSDNTAEVSADIIKKYPTTDVIYIHQKNKGLSAARNTGIKKSSGIYIVLLDSDDMISADKIEKEVAYLSAHPEIDIVYGKHTFQLEEGATLAGRREDFSPFPEGNISKELILQGAVFMPVHTCLVRKSVFDEVGGFSESIPAMEDVEFWVRCCLKGKVFGFHNDAVAIYRVRESSMSSNVEKMYSSFIGILNSIKTDDLEIKKAIDYQLGQCNLMLSINAYMGGDMPKHLLHLAKAESQNSPRVKAFKFVTKLPRKLAKFLINKISTSTFNEN